MRATVLLLLTSCGLQSFDLDEAKVRRGCVLAEAEDARAGPICDRLDAFGVPVDDMPATCGLPQYRRLEGCAMWPGRPWPLYSRARIYVAIGQDDEVAIVRHEVLNLVLWDERYDP
jgi:hypothetical protein